MSAKREPNSPIKQEGDSKRPRIKEEHVGDSKLQIGTTSLAPGTLFPKSEAPEDAKPDFDTQVGSPYLSYQPSKKRRRSTPPYVNVYLGNRMSCRAHYDPSRRRVLLNVEISSGQAAQVISRLCTVGFRLENMPSWDIYYTPDSKIKDMNWAFDVNEIPPKSEDLQEAESWKLDVLNTKPESNPNFIPVATRNRPALPAFAVASADSIMSQDQLQPADPVETEDIKTEETINGIPVIDLTGDD